ncbi:MAG TPA: ribosome biogenesis GTPase Der [Opitutaceae bacterium]|jgi:GTP-binding protein
MFRSVVIVGRPNVGKSRLFNRLARRRISIVHDQPGVTRDVVSAEVGGYTLMDTGGLGLKEGETSSKAIIEASERQVGFAIDTAAVIVFIIDGLDRVTALDDRIAARLRRGGKPVILVVNKADFGDEKADHEGVARLGLGEPVFVSAEHGRGEEELRRAIDDRLGRLGPGPGEEPAGDAPAKGPGSPICISFIGRPNVGKSSLANRLLKSDRLIVSEVAGTTRDAVELPFDFKGRDGKMHPFRLIDTAGIKAATKLATSVEYFSRLRSLDAMQRSDVVFLVLDAVDGVTQQDKAIAGEAVRDRKPIAVIVNKWDLVHETFRRDGAIQGAKSERDYREKYEKALFDRLFFTPGAPLIFVSAVSGYEVDRMLNAAVRLHRTLDKKLATSRLNDTLSYLAQRTPPPAIGARRFKIYYATQTGNRPFRVKIFCNREERLTESYRRYLEAGLVKEFGLNGCPVEFELVGKPRDGAGE